ncbi:NUDIX hydrolase [Candidatus Dojkabacteria bacterium]|uniref:NUDIX hydrolase n=1 Tax=Candidatus Dojkabacteria bacterium TaxID=2099670 RepID=A0A955L5V5_9BACT|nr:NUDIX hydrolase [Candidatus Dojkabacteria bacterium]
MKTILNFAQKAFIFNEESKILVIKFKSNKYQNKKLAGKYGLPGGQMNLGEEPNESIIREVQEETGVEIIPSLPFYTWTWSYTKENGTHKQIVAIARLAKYIKGDPRINMQENESILEDALFISLDNLNSTNFVIDEYPAIERYLEYKSINPFS